MILPSQADARADLVRVMRAMSDRGLNRGTSGNASARCAEGVLVTPTGVPSEELTPESMVLIDADGAWDPAGYRPSSEWRMHKGILDGRQDAAAVVHCHSHYATVLACMGLPIPAVHYMVRVSGGFTVEVAPYAVFGSEALARSVIATLSGRNACLMANHGQIAVAATLSRALTIAEQIEEQAAIYWGALAIGRPNLLTDAQMEEVLQQHRGYGQQR